MTDESEAFCTIDADELEAAKRDPKVRAFAQEAKAYCDKLVERGHCPSHLVVNCNCRAMRVLKERDRYRDALSHLAAWIDGWRDEVDGAPEERWKAAFKDTTPELRAAREALERSA